jgi:2-oxoglutarate ferredoxin oxidoreductase subunit alpha
MKARQRPTINLAITGTGGAGVMTAGEILLNAAAACGRYGLMSRSSGPQIRGGEAAAFVRIANAPVGAPGDRIDVLAALDWLNIERFASELTLDGDSLVLHEQASAAVPEFVRASGARLVPIAWEAIVRGIAGGRANLVIVGLAGALAGLTQDGLVAATLARFAGAESDAISAYEAAVRAGYAAGAAIEAPIVLPVVSSGAGMRWRITGNQAVGLGALRAGVRFVAAYPITPATEILEWLAPRIESLGGALVQAEDELASINMAMGASFAGIPALTATAGPGLSLMCEGIGLAVASETPVVVVDVMRGGPSTGIPAKSEQSDLGIALHGMHGDAPHVVAAPLSIADCVQTSAWVVSLAERLQTPAILLSDQALGQSLAIIDPPNENQHIAARELADDGTTSYRRYALTASGVSPMAVPGMAGGEYVAEGLEHSEGGRPSSDSRDHSAQLDKRQRKLDTHDYGPLWAHIEGQGDLAILTWGSSTGAAQEARARLGDEGVETRLIALRLLMPARVEALQQALDGVRRLLVVEQSHSRQFFQYLRAHYELPAQRRCLHRPGPLPIRAREIVAAVQQWGSP